MNRAVVLLSGGMDSSVLLHHLKAEGWELDALGVDYGQRHRKELDCAWHQARAAAVEFTVVDLSDLAWQVFGGSCLTTQSLDVPMGHYSEPSMRLTVVPNRNMVLLSLALARCVSLDFDGVAYAAHAGDEAVYPDCRRPFVARMDLVAQVCDYKPRSIFAPFVGWSKREIAERGRALGVDFSRTWSCYSGLSKPCGTCGTCVARAEALA